MNPEQLLGNINSIVCGSFGCLRNKQLFSKKEIFMNPETLIADVAELMKSANEQGILSAHVCYFDGKLQVLRAHHTTKQHTVFFLLNARQLRDGLSPLEWGTLGHRLANFFKEKI